jgi:six-hairpin glycosidase
VKANNKVEADRGRIAVERGPIVYCAEWVDNDFDVLSLFMNQAPKFELVKKPDVLHGINELKTDAQLLSYNDEGRLTTKDVRVTLIPYYAWAHRGAGAMAVWLPQELSASRPSMPPTLASESKVDASHKVTAISAINDRLIPKDENDRSIPYYHWWPKQGTIEWISYELPQETLVASATVYWFDDAPWGGCRVPKAWRIYYKDTAGEWCPVQNADSYGVVKGAANTVNFDPVKTTAVKLEVIQPDQFSTGLFEWEVK